LDGGERGGRLLGHRGDSLEDGVGANWERREKGGGGREVKGERRLLRALSSQLRGGGKRQGGLGSGKVLEGRGGEKRV